MILSKYLFPAIYLHRVNKEKIQLTVRGADSSSGVRWSLVCISSAMLSVVVVRLAMGSVISLCSSLALVRSFLANAILESLR